MRIAALVFVLAAPFTNAAQVAQDDLLAQARPAIEAANADWIPAMKRGDAKAIASAYAPDGVFVAPAGEVIPLGATSARDPARDSRDAVGRSPARAAAS